MDASRKFTCEICEKSFTTNKWKDKHIGIVHGEEKEFECNVCTRVFGNPGTLLFHVKNSQNVVWQVSQTEMRVFVYISCQKFTKRCVTSVTNKMRVFVYITTRNPTSKHSSNFYLFCFFLSKFVSEKLLQFEIAESIFFDILRVLRTMFANRSISRPSDQLTQKLTFQHFRWSLDKDSYPKY